MTAPSNSSVRQVYTFLSRPNRSKQTRGARRPDAEPSVKHADWTSGSGRSTRMHVESYPDALVADDLREQALALQDQAWPPDPDDVPTGHDPALNPVAVLLIEDGRVVACLDILSKQFNHAGQNYQASGISAMVTDTALRRQGYGHRLVVEARALIERGGADLGIFTCDRPLAGFYERAGWSVLPGTVLIGGTPDEPFPSDRFDKVTLATFFTERAHHNADHFKGARIALYPGDIDKLW
ncbi:MAG: GNAT family N-acetyltransferase [Sciscionella sp.]